MGMGSWELTMDTADIISHGLDLGYRMIDTSSDYGSQTGVGEGIRMSGLPREDIFLITKVEEDDDSYKRAKANLKELQLDYVDLLLIHRPPRAQSASEKLWEGLIRARKEGLTRDIGVSNYSSDQINKLIEMSGEIPVVNQIEWSPFGHSRKMLQFCQDKKIAIMAYSPLIREERIQDKTLKEIADIHGKNPEQILIRWNLQLGTIPIPKANQLRHLEENIDVFDFELGEEDMRTLNILNEHYSSLGSLQYL